MLFFQISDNVTKYILFSTKEGEEGKIEPKEKG